MAQKLGVRYRKIQKKRQRVCNRFLRCYCFGSKLFKSQKKELHLTTGKRIKILDIARIVKKIANKKNLKIIRGKKIDDVQLNKSNNSNGYLRKFWKPIISIEEGIEKIYYYYKEKNKIKN